MGFIAKLFSRFLGLSILGKIQNVITFILIVGIVYGFFSIIYPVAGRLLELFSSITGNLGLNRYFGDNNNSIGCIFGQGFFENMKNFLQIVITIYLLRYTTPIAVFIYTFGKFVITAGMRLIEKTLNVPA